MKLFYSTGTCSLASHLLLHEIGLPFSSVSVNIMDKTYEGGGDFRKLNPKGYAPALELDSKEILTENVIIMQYVADRRPEAGMIPGHGTLERYRLLELMNFMSTEIHKCFSPLFDPALSMPPEGQTKFKDKIGIRFDYLNERIDGSQFAFGKQYTIADPYLFTMLVLAKYSNLDMSRWPKLMGHFEKIRNRPATNETLAKEGLASKV